MSARAPAFGPNRGQRVVRVGLGAHSIASGLAPAEHCYELYLKFGKCLTPCARYIGDGVPPALFPGNGKMTKAEEKRSKELHGKWSEKDVEEHAKKIQEYQAAVEGQEGSGSGSGSGNFGRAEAVVCCATSNGQGRGRAPSLPLAVCADAPFLAAAGAAAGRPGLHRHGLPCQARGHGPRRGGRLHVRRPVPPLQDVRGVHSEQGLAHGAAPRGGPDFVAPAPLGRRRLALQLRLVPEQVRHWQPDGALHWRRLVPRLAVQGSAVPGATLA